MGEWLALTGDTIGAGDAIAVGLADGCLPVEQLTPCGTRWVRRRLPMVRRCSLLLLLN